MAKVVVIGGGPAGMMASIAAAEKHSVVLLEKNEKLGKKLYITGKGRCNITNSKDIGDFFDYITGNPEFLYSALYTFTNDDTMRFFNDLGVELKVERGGRVFPSSDKSSDIINAFQRLLLKKNVNVILNSEVKDLICTGNNVGAAVLSDDRVIYGDYFIICTGGVSYPKTGSTGEGHKWAKRLGHKVTRLVPSLVPIITEEQWAMDLQGLSLKNIELQIKNKEGKQLFREQGEMLFTHFGITGPLVLSASRVVNEDESLCAVINLKPALTYDELDKRVQNDFKKYINKDFKNSLVDLFPERLISTIVTLSGIDENKKVNLITKEERKTLIRLIQNLTLKISGLRPIEEAIVTAGGVDVNEVFSSTMQSKLINNLYFAGEILDVDAYTGGYNIQIAISTGYLAGSRIGDKE